MKNELTSERIGGRQGSEREDKGEEGDRGEVHRSESKRVWEVRTKEGRGKERSELVIKSELSIEFDLRKAVYLRSPRPSTHHFPFKDHRSHASCRAIVPLRSVECETSEISNRLTGRRYARRRYERERVRHDEEETSRGGATVNGKKSVL